MLSRINLISIYLHIYIYVVYLILFMYVYERRVIRVTDVRKRRLIVPGDG